MLSFVMQHLLAVLSVTQGRLRAGPSPLGVSVLCLASLRGYCATGGGYHGGGVFGPLGTMVPWGDSPREGRAAHGPLHPAVFIPLGCCCGFCRVFVFGSSGLCLFVVKPLLFPRGRCCCLVF